MPIIETVYMAGVFVKSGATVQNGQKGFAVLMTREQRDAAIKSPEAAAHIGTYVVGILREHASSWLPHGQEEHNLLLLNIEANPEYYTSVVEQLMHERGDTAVLLAIDVTPLVLDSGVDEVSQKAH